MGGRQGCVLNSERHFMVFIEFFFFCIRVSVFLKSEASLGTWTVLQLKVTNSVQRLETISEVHSFENLV